MRGSWIKYKDVEHLLKPPVIASELLAITNINKTKRSDESRGNPADVVIPCTAGNKALNVAMSVNDATNLYLELGHTLFGNDRYQE